MAHIIHDERQQTRNCAERKRENSKVQGTEKFLVWRYEHNLNWRVALGLRLQIVHLRLIGQLKSLMPHNSTEEARNPGL